MGICASCLGLRRRESYDPEGSRLLYNDDLFQSNYGAFHGPQHNGGYHQNPEDAKREREALDTITQRTSDSVIDIFALQPHGTPGPASDHSSRASDHQTLLKHVHIPEDLNKARPSTPTVSNGVASDSKSDSSPKSDFGTIKRSRKGNLVSKIVLD